MSPSKLLKSAAIPLAALCLAPPAALAQGNSGQTYQVLQETVKPGAAAQFEQGVKQVDAWAGGHGDTVGTSAYEIVTGPDTGNIVVLVPLDWTSMDHPPSYEAGLDREATKVVEPYIASLQRSIVQVLPNLGNVPPANTPPEKYYQIIQLTIKPGKMNDFIATVARISAAESKENPSPNPFIVYAQQYGGSPNLVTIAIGHPSWVDFARRGKPMADVLRQAYGATAASSLTDTLDSTIADEQIQIVVYRPDLSFIPGGQK
jgi:hypothetical protein